MARRRMVPTSFFKDADITTLSRDAQLVLLCLILIADDEGREVAFADVLGREVNHSAQEVESALHNLVANDLIQLYRVGRHRYYQLTRWHQWQTLGGRITPSHHPAPPEQKPTTSHTEQAPSEEKSGPVEQNSTSEEASCEREQPPGKSEEDMGKMPENSQTLPEPGNLRGTESRGDEHLQSEEASCEREQPPGKSEEDAQKQSTGKNGEDTGKTRGNSQTFPEQLNLREEKKSEEKKSEEKREEGEHPQSAEKHLSISSPPSLNIPPFLPSSFAAADAGDLLFEKRLSELERERLVQQLADILHLPVTDALRRLVTDYAPISSLSLSGEADTAREWIDDPRKNCQRQHMSLAFFRRWLKREIEGLERRRVSMRHEMIAQANRIAEKTAPVREALPEVGRLPSLMHLLEEDQRARRGVC